MKEVKLFWEGLWDITEQTAPLNIPESGGILMLIDAQYTPNKIGFDTCSYRLIDFEESSNMYKSVMGLGKFHDWKNHSPNRLLLKIAKVENPGDRVLFIQLLTGNPDAPSDVLLSNTGYKLPLKACYSAPVKEPAA